MSLKNSVDVFKELVEDSSDSWLLGLVAFAVFEERRIEWMRHWEGLNGRPPNSEEVQSWYLDQPEGTILSVKGTAENALIVFSDEVSQQQLTDYGDEIRESIIVTEIKYLRRFWPAFGMNLFTGILSAFLFSLMVAAFYLVVFVDLSPTDFVDSLNGQEIEESKNGEEVR